MSNYNFFCPTRVLFGQGSLNEFHKQPMPGKKHYWLFQMVNLRSKMVL